MRKKEDELNKFQIKSKQPFFPATNTKKKKNSKKKKIKK